MVEEYNNHGGNVDENAVAVVNDGKFFAVIGYLSFMCFVPLYFKRDNEFARFHGKQALILFLLEIAAGILRVVPIIGALISWVGFVLFGLASLYAIYKVFTGEYFKIPFVSEIAEKVTL